jgi:adenylate kinase
MKLVVIGPPGSGKGTISVKLANDFKWYHLSPGELLREEVSKDTTIGKDIKKYMDKGELVPDGFVDALVKLDLSDKKDYILDGYPRTLSSAEKIKIDKVLYLDVADKIVVSRLKNRLFCPWCEAGYHETLLPPQKKGICDKCKHKLITRKDDQPTAVRERLKIFHNLTSKVIDYYEKKGKLVKVNGDHSPEEVYNNVKKSLGF